MAGLSLRHARSLIDAALAKADEIGVASNVAVVDAGNNLTAFVRQDGAWLGSIDVAHGKAYTARALDLPTKDLYSQVQPAGQLYGLAAGSRAQLITFAGGGPVTDGDTVVGAIGVSGGTVEQDQQIAEAGVEAYHRD